MSQTSEAGQEIAARFNGANAAFREGRWAVALEGFEAALVLDEQLEPAGIQAARCHANLGNWAAARDAFARVLMINPASYTAWLESGHACRRLGLFDDAEAAYRRAAGLAPNRHEAFVSLARLQEEFGHFDAADETLAKALDAARTTSMQTVAMVHRMMARYRIEQKMPERALASLEVGIRIAADAGADVNELCEWQLDRGNALMLMGEKERAYKAFGAASASTVEATLQRLAQVSYAHNLWVEAGDVLRRSAELNPASPHSLLALAKHLAECWNITEAEQLLDKVDAFGPNAESAGIRANMDIRRGDAEAAVNILIEEAKANHTGGRECSRVAMTSLYCDTYDAKGILDLHKWLFEPLAAHARDRSSLRRKPLKGRRIRLGFIAADLHYQHPVNIFMQPILRELDREKFECFVYACGGLFDDQTRLARERAEHWLEVEAWSDTQLAARIEQDQIDILVDLLGHTAHSRGAMLARRAAPYQVNYLGYPGTTGLPNMDWLISDGVVTPEGAEEFYSEKIARLPGTVFCYAPEEEYPLPTFNAEMETRQLTFGAVNNAAKFSRKTLALYARVLEAVPNSRMIIRAPSFGDKQAVALFQQRFEELGTDLSRLTFLPPVAMPDMMAAYADIDVVLDPHPYNGGTTTMQALWMGVPVITLEGHQFVSRMGASFVRAAGLEDWVAANEDAYVAVAVAKTKNRKQLLNLKKGMRKKLLARPAWDPVAHTRNFEKALLDIIDSESVIPAE